MTELLFFVAGILVGGIVILIYYRRHVNEVEAKLLNAVALRKTVEEQLNSLKVKIGG